MDRLNYFNPYHTIDGAHENQLTRAYLVLLKHSSHAFFTFVEYCRSQQTVLADEKPISIIDYIEQGWNIETQKGNPDITTSYLLSVLITDEHFEMDTSNIRSSERNARYDGVVTFGNSVTMIIENKPRSTSVWFGQLNPSRQNLSDDTQIYAHPCVLEWKEIIKHLNHLLYISTLSGYESMMIQDFLSFVDDNHPSLNPYDSVDRCKGNKELLNRRIENILKAISVDDSNVYYHPGWGHYLRTEYDQIKMIGLILDYNGDEWHFDVSLYYGDTQKQARSFYSSGISLAHLDKSLWIIDPNFHFSYRTSNLVHFESGDYGVYLEYWKENANQLRQIKRDEVSLYVENLANLNVININEDVQNKMQTRFYGTKLPSLNVCPGFGVRFKISSTDAENLDKSGVLEKLVAEKMREGLMIIGKSGDGVIKQL